jgi:hypothetical protein
MIFYRYNLISPSVMTAAMAIKNEALAAKIITICTNFKYPLEWQRSYGAKGGDWDPMMRLIYYRRNYHYSAPGQPCE